MSIDFQDITIIANPEPAQVRDGSSKTFQEISLSTLWRAHP